MIFEKGIVSNVLASGMILAGGLSEASLNEEKPAIDQELDATGLEQENLMKSQPASGFEKVEMLEGPLVIVEEAFPFDKSSFIAEFSRIAIDNEHAFLDVPEGAFSDDSLFLTSEKFPECSSEIYFYDVTDSSIVLSLGTTGLNVHLQDPDLVLTNRYYTDGIFSHGAGDIGINLSDSISDTVSPVDALEFAVSITNLACGNFIARSG